MLYCIRQAYMRSPRPTIFSIITVVSLTVALSVMTFPTSRAAGLMSESFAGVSTPANAWISGGSGGTVACLTAASSSAANSIPACSGGPIDSVGNGVLRLTPAEDARSGFAIFNTPVSADEGLNIEFDMYQYGGSGADGISFFLIDGAANPTQPGASGGSLGYSGSDSENPGIDGGYVGIGFDRYGNFSSSGAGPGGPGALANAIAIRGSEASGYQFVSNKAAAGQLAGTTRSNSKRPVRITISTNNIMTVQVDYGSGYVTELSNIDLKSINGAESFPESFKFGFAASTGGFNNTHEIGGLTVETNPPNVSLSVDYADSYVQGQSGTFSVTATNDASAEDTAGAISVQSTLPSGLTPTSASGTGWQCGVAGQVVTCTREDVLAPGATTPAIEVAFDVAGDAPAELDNTVEVSVSDNANPSPSVESTLTILSADYLDEDGVTNVVEAAAPNGGDANDDSIPDNEQANVTSLVNPVTGEYVTLAASGCEDGNANVQVTDQTDIGVEDGDFSYPVGLLGFTLSCANPGDEATITQYFFAEFDAEEFEARKYSEALESFATIEAAVIETVEIGGQSALKVEYTVVDGDELDEDGLVNGEIVDPSGPAVLAASTPGSDPTPTPTPTPSLTSSAPTPTPTSLSGGKLPGTGASVLWFSALGGAMLSLGLWRLFATYRTAR